MAFSYCQNLLLHISDFFLIIPVNFQEKQPAIFTSKMGLFVSSGGITTQDMQAMASLEIKGKGRGWEGLL